MGAPAAAPTNTHIFNDKPKTIVEHFECVATASGQPENVGLMPLPLMVLQWASRLYSNNDNAFDT